MRSTEDIMLNNPSFGSNIDENQNQNQEAQDDMEEIMKQGKAAFNTGWSYLKWGAQAAKKKADDTGVTDAMSRTAQNAKQKSDEFGISDKASIFK